VIQPTWPDIYWKITWPNLHDAPIPQYHKAVWYKNIHDIVRTNVRLNKINMSPKDKCKYCASIDTLTHRHTECGNGKLIRNWTATKIATILRTTTRYIPTVWTTLPNCHIRPHTRKRAVLWLFAQIVIFRQEEYHISTLRDYITYVKRRKMNCTRTLIGERWLRTTYLLWTNPDKLYQHPSCNDPTQSDVKGTSWSSSRFSFYLFIYLFYLFMYLFL
jgi:hypothetical protein